MLQGALDVFRSRSLARALTRMHILQVGQQQGPIDPRSRNQQAYELPEPGQQGGYGQWMEVPDSRQQQQQQPWQVSLQLTGQALQASSPAA